MTNEFEKRQNIKVAFNVQKTREKDDLNKKNKYSRRVSWTESTRSGILLTQSPKRRCGSLLCTSATKRGRIAARLVSQTAERRTTCIGTSSKCRWIWTKGRTATTKSWRGATAKSWSITTKCGTGPKRRTRAKSRGSTKCRRTSEGWSSTKCSRWNNIWENGYIICTIILTWLFCVYMSFFTWLIKFMSLKILTVKYLLFNEKKKKVV